MTKAELLRAIRDMDDDDRRELLAALRDDSDADDEFGIANAVGERAGTPPRGFTKPRALTKPTSAADSLAMDAAPATARGQAQLRIAAELCESVIGRETVLACDSAESIVRTALLALGAPTARTAHVDALPAMLSAALRGQRTTTATRSPIGLFRPVLAADRGDNFAKRFPAVARVRAA